MDAGPRAKGGTSGHSFGTLARQNRSVTAESSMRILRLAIVLAAPLVAGAAAPGAPQLAFPLACKLGQTCEIQHYVDRDPGPGARDYRCGPQTYQAHNGVDIRLLDMAAQRRGAPVLAAAAGRVARLRDGVPDIAVNAPGAPPLNGQECGNGVVVDHGAGWETQYCHMARGSLRVKVGQQVAAGTALGNVGLSGATEYPHLHFTVRQAGKVVDPFGPDVASPGDCKAQPSLWTPETAALMSYKPAVVLNTGFSSAPVTMEALEAGAVPPATPAGAALVAYARGIALHQGDKLELVLKDPKGAVLAQTLTPPLDRWKAQYFLYVGKKRPPGGWTPGVYVAENRVWRTGKVAATRRFQAQL